MTQDIKDPVFDRWLGDGNFWYLQDEEANTYANAIAKQRPEWKRGAGLTDQEYRQYLDAVSAKVRGAMPQKFVNPQRSRVAAVDAGSNRSGEGGVGGGKNSYESLPSEAKVACDRYISKGLFKSRAEYTKLFFEKE